MGLLRCPLTIDSQREEGERESEQEGEEERMHSLWGRCQGDFVVFWWRVESSRWREGFLAAMGIRELETQRN